MRGLLQVVIESVVKRISRRIFCRRFMHLLQSRSTAIIWSRGMLWGSHTELQADGSHWDSELPTQRRRFAVYKHAQPSKMASWSANQRQSTENHGLMKISLFFIIET